MFEWIFLLFAPPQPVQYEPPKPKNYIGVVAAEVAYATAQSQGVAPAPDVKPRVPDPNCKTCQGTGKVPSGDKLSWTKCPTCMADLPKAAAADMPPLVPVPFRAAPVQSIPPQSNACPTGTCPADSRPATTVAVPAVPIIVDPGWRTVRRR